ncbi:hypothetical protein BI081_gp058 [Mycobacterium phage Tonenili]|uniref:Uncharacterized protein n=1 Tax=Mycobacterium phage Tonenili TaxID=1891703 RepID=A0A1C9EH35_9CAUD|nr:hypothetical protein BI081_gp058 [Mycobacterium phage Tonenili]AON96809.1 hypothetical protein SEA_TONENILI_58 [Mycobacterium phage Tonenili]
MATVVAAWRPLKLSTGYILETPRATFWVEKISAPGERSFWQMKLRRKNTDDRTVLVWQHDLTARSLKAEAERLDADWTEEN